VDSDGDITASVLMLVFIPNPNFIKISYLLHEFRKWELCAFI